MKGAVGACSGPGKFAPVPPPSFSLSTLLASVLHHVGHGFKPCPHCLKNITADMNNKRLIPYVELITRPRRVRARSPETSPEIPGSPKLSPRKKRRIQEDDPLEDNLMKKV